MEAVMRDTARPPHATPSPERQDEASGIKCPGTQVTKLAREDCPKFDKCSANICPIDAEMIFRSHLAGEPVCLYLREYAKPAVRPFLGGCIPPELLEAIRTEGSARS